MEINCDAVSVADYNPDRAIQLWWDNKVRHPNQKTTKEVQKACKKPMVPRVKVNQMVNRMMISSLTDSKIKLKKPWSLFTQVGLN